MYSKTTNIHLLVTLCTDKVIVEALRCVCAECWFIVVAYPSFVARPHAGKRVQCSRWLLRPTLLGHPDDTVRDY